MLVIQLLDCDYVMLNKNYHVTRHLLYSIVFYCVLLYSRVSYVVTSTQEWIKGLYQGRLLYCFIDWLLKRSEMR
jgi:hypothetical protein